MAKARCTGRPTGKDRSLLPQTPATIRSNTINASRREAAEMTVPKEVESTDWSVTDLVGWRDRKAPLLGYLVFDGESGPVTLMVRAAQSSMSAGRSAMCLLCGTVRKANQISLFTARRTGSAGRNGNTVGTYMCADLTCAAQVRHHPLNRGKELADDEIAARSAQMLERVRAFAADVQRT